MSPRRAIAPSTPVGHDPDPLVALSYVSFAVAPFFDRDMTDLLFAARRFNAQVGVTGNLLVLEDAVTGRVVQFVQWIEGTAPAVEGVYERIRRDPRHRVIEVLRRGAVAGRRYAEWDMAFGRTTDERAYAAAVGLAA